jgi:hypothetical protein
MSLVESTHRVPSGKARTTRSPAARVIVRWVRLSTISTSIWHRRHKPRQRATSVFARFHLELQAMRIALIAVRQCDAVTI